MFKNPLLIITLFISLNTFTQNEFSVMVIDSSESTPMFGVKVVLKGTGNGVLTDEFRDLSKC